MSSNSVRIILILLYSVILSAAPRPEETAVKYIYVAPLPISIQRELIETLNKKSYWSAAPYSPSTQLKKHSAILTGELKGKNLKVILKKHPTGKVLASWLFTIKESRALADEVAETLIIDNPYQGFVTARRGRKVRLNLGTNSSLRQGSELELFEFEEGHFSSEQEPIAKVRVTELRSQSSFAEIISRDNDVPLYSKAKLIRDNQKTLPGMGAKYYDDYWLGGGGDLIFIDSRASSGSSKLSKRLYQLTLTPFVTARTGYRRLNGAIGFATAENASNRVRFLNAEISYELISRTANRWGFITSLGALYSSVQSENKANATHPLISSTVLAPFVEQSVLLGISNRSKLVLSGQLQIPKVSNDELNGTSQIGGSFGAKGLFGLRLQISPTLAIESGINYQLSQYVFTAGESVLETVFGVSGILLYRL